MKSFLKINELLTISFILIFQLCHSATWRVGPAQQFILPSQVSTLVNAGDTIQIDSGVYYADVAHWTADNLFILCSDGFARLHSAGLTWGDKGIWVISGNNVTVKNIEFVSATSTSHNGAGIRQEGRNVFIQNCRFYFNENGILAGAVNPSTIRIENCDFGWNGYGDGYTHNVYIGNVDTLIFKYNYSHQASVGHELKSRANVNYIMYNRISDEDSTASRNIDLPNGGRAFIIGNITEQGSQSQNSNIIGYGLEGLTNNSPHELYAINNTIVNDKSSGSFFNLQNGTSVFKAYNNIIAGPGSFISGNAQTMDTSSNIFDVVQGFNFTDPMNYDYSLTAGSTDAIDAGINPGFAGGLSLIPSEIYVHPAMSSARCFSGNPDAGAYEYCSSTPVREIDNPEINISESGKNIFKIETGQDSMDEILIIDEKGCLIKYAVNISSPFYFDGTSMPASVLHIILIIGGQLIAKNIFVE
jgi:hypothetical protein